MSSMGLETLPPPRCPHGPPRPAPPPGPLSPTNTTGSPAADPDAPQAAATTPNLLRVANWDQMTRKQRYNWKRHHKPKKRKGGA